MKLYYTGDQNGELKYSLDGRSFIPTTLENLRAGVTLPDNIDYSNVIVKAGSRVLNSLNVIHNIAVEATEPDFSNIKNLLNIVLMSKEYTSTDAEDYHWTIADYDYYISINGAEQPDEGFNSNEFFIAFQNNSTGEIRKVLKGREDDSSEWNYVLGYMGYEQKIVLLDLGGIEPFFVN
jgi:hypothetical protein